MDCELLFAASCLERIPQGDGATISSFNRCLRSTKMHAHQRIGKLAFQAGDTVNHPEEEIGRTDIAAPQSETERSGPVGNENT
ncbi:hypothetical protein ATY77_06290 [Rhizobium sp. R634]|uniref:hypothetical protein n=1 Tax=Rhizobium sp. R634 TaxID=1764274 RepID=UPI000B5340DE|nr:hypothetical protein [Rhizobium sp. R634]OWV76172.1 hypothetical protein ATY77_06290 [Rhizobium sp. R634]